MIPLVATPPDVRFKAAGALGIAASALAAWRLAQAWSLNARVTLLLYLTAFLTAYTLAVIEKHVRGREVLVYYHHQFAVLASSILMLVLVKQPILPYLDLTAVCLGVFLACGRIGCFLTGCCHGRPHRLGVACYGRHIPEYLEGIRLAPVQLIEAAWVLLAVASAILMRSTAGSGLSIYLGLYAAGRLWFETLRGDASRPYARAFSEAQWSSVGTLAFLLVASVFHLLPFYSWQALALAGAVAIARPIGLFSAAHTHEIAQALDLALRNSASGRLYVAETSRGLRVSASAVHEDERTVQLFSFSSVHGPLPDPSVQRLAALAAVLRRCDTGSELARGNNGVFSILIPRHTPQPGGGHAV